MWGDILHPAQGESGHCGQDWVRQVQSFPGSVPYCRDTPGGYQSGWKLHQVS